MRIPHIPFSEILHFVEVLAIVGAATFAAFQLRALRLHNSADLTLRLGQELDTGVNQNLVDALDADSTKPILTKSGGLFTGSAGISANTKRSMTSTEMTSSRAA